MRDIMLSRCHLSLSLCLGKHFCVHNNSGKLQTQKVLACTKRGQLLGWSMWYEQCWWAVLPLSHMNYFNNDWLDCCGILDSDLCPSLNVWPNIHKAKINPIFPHYVLWKLYKRLLVKCHWYRHVSLKHVAPAHTEMFVSKWFNSKTEPHSITVFL